MKLKKHEIVPALVCLVAEVIPACLFMLVAVFVIIYPLAKYVLGLLH